MLAISQIALTLTLSLPLLAQDPVPAKQPPKPAPVEASDAKQNDNKPEKKVLALGQRLDGATTLTDIDGKTQKAKDLMGKLTVVNFYSIQCPIQRAWDDRLAALQTKYAAQGVVFLHIDSNVTEIGAEAPKDTDDAKPYGKVREHLAARKLPFRVLVDHGNKIADLFDARTTPHIYVFGKDGKLVYKGLVDDDAKDKNADSRTNYLANTIDKLLAGEKVEPFATKEEGCTIKRLPKEGEQNEGRRQRRQGGGGERGGK